MSADVCYTCWEDEDYCEYSEGFDSTLERMKNNDFDDGDGPKSVDDIRGMI